MILEKSNELNLLTLYVFKNVILLWVMISMAITNWIVILTPLFSSSLWMLFVLFEFALKREVSAVINPAKIGMILRVPVLPESNQMVRGTFQDHFTSILYVTASIPICEIPGFL